MKSKIIEAFAAFDEGQRPDGHKPPRHWYVLDKNGKAYPAKTIWALAINVASGDTNTGAARRGLAKYYYSLVDTRNIYLQEEDHNNVSDSIADTSAKRKARLAIAQTKPNEKYVLVKIFDRNPDVIAEVLIRANGKCEKCDNPAPFLRYKDKTPYLEVHHKVHLSKGGDDAVENAIALCPNCHRECHFGH